MKRLMIGLCILVTLLAGSLAITLSMSAVHGPIADELGLAVQASLDGDQAAALAHADAAVARWEKYRNFTAAFADHTPMDEMDALLAEARIYAHETDSVHFCATCAHLQQIAQAISDAHRIDWWNLL